MSAAPKLTFWGHIIDKEGITPLHDKIDTINVFPIPSTIRQVCRFLGMANYYRQFISNYASIILPLTSLLSRHKKKNATISLSADERNAFEEAKQSLKTFSKLSYVNSSLDAKLTLTTDASSDTIGAVLHQVIDGTERPLSFFSVKLNNAQWKYSAFSRELLAIYLAIRHYRHILEGREFTVYTDHKPLVYALSAKANKHNPRDIRYLDYISQFTSDIQYIKGSSNTVADTLSRSGLNSIQTHSLNFDALADEPEQDDTLRTVKTDTSLLLEKRPLSFTDRLIYCDVSTGNPRPYIPPSMRRDVFHYFHDQSHPGSNASWRTISARFVWPGMATDIKQWTRTCIRCQTTKVNKHTKALLSSFPPPDGRFSHLHVNLVGPLKNIEGCEYIL